ncbi:hypothetical protein DOY81_006043 [Sarcophaga bullata]|nr:hypothetical protein DOY81_006043 [Sarcophaga bullata]
MLSLILIYRPPSLNVNAFIEELNITINKINNKQEIMVVGDINIDILRGNNTTTNCLNVIMSNGLQCMIQEITREENMTLKISVEMEY